MIAKNSLPASATTALLLSFVTTTLLGAGFVYSFWSTTNVDLAVQRSILFIVAMAIVHVAGHAVYARQIPLLCDSASSAPPPSLRQIGRNMSARTAWLGGFVVCLALSGKQFLTGYEFRQSILESGRTLDSVPPTMLTTNPAAGVAFLCVSLVCLLAAFRQKPQPRVTSD